MINHDFMQIIEINFRQSFRPLFFVEIFFVFLFLYVWRRAHRIQGGFMAAQLFLPGFVWSWLRSWLVTKTHLLHSPYTMLHGHGFSFFLYFFVVILIYLSLVFAEKRSSSVFYEKQLPLRFFILLVIVSFLLVLSYHFLIMVLPFASIATGDATHRSILNFYPIFDSILICAEWFFLVWFARKVYPFVRTRDQSPVYAGLVSALAVIFVFIPFLAFWLLFRPLFT